MPSSPTDDQLLRSHLLGELSEEEAEGVEQRLLEDDEFFLLGEAIEADLLAALDRGHLAPGEKEKVLEHLAASASGRRRLALARFLNAAADRQFAIKPWTAPWVLIRQALGSLRPGMRWATLVAAILLPTAAVWIARENRHSSEQIANQITRATPPWPARQRSVPPAPEEPPIAEGRGVDNKGRNPLPPVESLAPAVLELSLMTLRGAEPSALPTLDIPPGTRLVEIRIDIEGLEDAESFHAAVHSKERNETVWGTRTLELTELEWGKGLVLEIPAKHLASGRYEVAVTAGTEEVPVIQEFEVVREDR